VEDGGLTLTSAFVAPKNIKNKLLLNLIYIYIYINGKKKKKYIYIYI